MLHTHTYMVEEASRIEDLARYFEDLRIKLARLHALCETGAKTNNSQTYNLLLSQVAKLTAEMKCITAILNSGTAIAHLLAARHPIEHLHCCSALTTLPPPPCIAPGCRGCLWDAFCVECTGFPI